MFSLLTQGGENILVSNQKSVVKWGNKIKAYYISKGYQYTKINEPFTVNTEDLFPGSKIHVAVSCDRCGKEFSTPFRAHVQRINNGEEDLCKSCAAKLGHKRIRPKHVEDVFSNVRSFCDEYGYELLTSEKEYTGANMKVAFVCPKHGVQTMPLYNLEHGRKCLPCSYEERARRARFTGDWVESVINGTNNNVLLNKEDYSSAVVKNLRIKCGTCGKHIFTTSLASYCGKGITRCRSCSRKESTGEKLVASCLRNLGVRFEREKRFPDCRDSRTLPFDFYIDKYNLVIEFDGPHHYKKMFSNEQLEKTKSHDAIKNEYCKTHGIEILRIPFWDSDDAEQLIINKLQHIVKTQTQVKDIV